MSKSYVDMSDEERKQAVDVFDTIQDVREQFNKEFLTYTVEFNSFIKQLMDFMEDKDKDRVDAQTYLDSIYSYCRHIEENLGQSLCNGLEVFDIDNEKKYQFDLYRFYPIPEKVKEPKQDDNVIQPEMEYFNKLANKKS